MEGSTMSTLLGDLGSVATEVLSIISEVVNTITGSPFLLLTTGVLILGAAVGIMGRLLSRN